MSIESVRRRLGAARSKSVMPKRIQLRRTKGWRKPEGAILWRAHWSG